MQAVQQSGQTLLSFNFIVKLGTLGIDIFVMFEVKVWRPIKPIFCQSLTLDRSSTFFTNIFIALLEKVKSI